MWIYAFINLLCVLYYKKVCSCYHIYFHVTAHSFIFNVFLFFLKLENQLRFWFVFIFSFFLNLNWKDLILKY